MNLRKERIQSLAVLTTVVVLIQWLLSAVIYPFFKVQTQNLFSITPATALASPVLGDKVIGLLTGILPAWGQFSTWLAIFFGTFAVLFAGYFVYESKIGKTIGQGKNIYQRLWFILLYGTIVLYAFLLITKIGTVADIAIPLIIGLAINYFIIAFIVSRLARRVKMIRI